MTATRSYTRPRSRSLVCALALGLVAAIAACSSGSDAGSAAGAPQSAGPAPDSFRVAFQTSRGPFVVEVHREWAPLGADRFYELVQTKFFDDQRFYRVVPNFVVQWGINDKRKLNEHWLSRRIRDDSVRQSNLRGMLTFATEGANTRAHQMFINLKDNSRLDRMGFSPIGKVVEGMDVVDSLYSGYGESPEAHFIQTMGNSYLTRVFPKLDYIKAAAVVP